MTPKHLSKHHFFLQVIPSTGESTRNRSSAWPNEVPNQVQGKHWNCVDPAISSKTNTTNGWSRRRGHLPHHFDENARIFWLYYAPLFINYGVLNALTCPAFELMCSEYGRFCVAAAKEQAQGSVQETPNGYETPTTWHSIAVKSQERLLKLLAAFGMMPHQRAIGELSDDLIGQL